MKEKRIIRTIKLTTAKIMFADTENQTMHVEDRDIVGTFKSDKDLLSYVTDPNCPAIKPIKVISSYEREEKRYMLESVFYSSSSPVIEQTNN